MDTMVRAAARRKFAPAGITALPYGMLMLSMLMLSMLTLCVPIIGASDTVYASSSSVDWTTGLIHASVELNLAGASLRLPSDRAEAERLIEAAVPDLVKDTVLGIGLDSYRTVADSLDDGSLDPTVLRAFLEAGNRVMLAMDRDMENMVARFEWRLPDLANLYVRHSAPMRLAVPTRSMPTRAYSGIVLYAQGGYPVRGEHGEASLRPCLFPRIYDDAMTPILDRNLVDPAALRSWGVVAYATGLDDPVVESRAGGNPLRIMVAGVFGSRRTDAMISVDDSQRILGLPENHELIRAGKVVFVLDLR
jgi:hypothetical protein